MDCRDFRDRLSASDAEEGLREHAERCPECATAWAAQQELEDALRQRFAAAPAGFSDRVMERLPARRARNVAPEVVDVTPWWLSWLTEPSALLGLTLGGLYALFAPRLFGLSQEAVPAIGRILRPAGHGLSELFSVFDFLGHVPGVGGWMLGLVLAAGGALALFQATQDLLSRWSGADR